MLPEEDIYFFQNENSISSINGLTIVKVVNFDYEAEDYFSFKRHLMRSYYHNKNSLLQCMKKKCELFHHTSSKELSQFEKIIMSNNDKSAIISMILRTFNLWNDETFWTKEVNLEKIMQHFANDINANIKNLFSILVHDWHCPNPDSSTYQLCVKFEKYFSSTGQSMFNKLFDIIDHDQYKYYGPVCLRIIYSYLHEKNEKLHETNTYYNRSLHQDSIYQAIEDSLNVKNQDFKFQVLKILTVFLDNTEDDNYNNLKSRILENVSHYFECKSTYRICLKSIEKHCDEKFFEIIFLLKENRLKKFEFDFEALVKIYQKYYGEYWKEAIKSNARLLLHLCENQFEMKLLKTVEFIFKQCSFIELNSSILTTFRENAEFYTILNEPLDKEDEIFLTSIHDLLKEDFENWLHNFKEKCIGNKRFTRKILFGRRNIHEMSLLEKILSDCRCYPIFNEIWNKFHLFEKPELLGFKNYMGKSLMDYAYSAGVNQVAAFLMLPSNRMLKNFKKHKYYMIMQNSQVYTLTGKSLIGHQIDVFLGIEELDDSVDLFSRVVYLFEEIGTINAIQDDEVINIILDLMKNTESYSSELFEIDVLLGIMLGYWNPHKGEYERYKRILIDINPFFELLFMVIEKKHDEFIESFQSKFNDIEKMYESRYDVSVTQKDSYIHQHELYSSNFMFILFLAAMSTRQHKIIDYIFKNDSFMTLNFQFPENVKPDEIHYYIALKLLKYKHELGGGNIPDDWLTHEVLEEFLNTRIRYCDNDYLEIDFSNLLHAESQKIKVKDSSDVTDKLLLLEDTVSLKYIKDHENLKELITHPAIEIYINLKIFKYQRIFVYNFWAFIFFFIVPYTSLIANNHNELLGSNNLKYYSTDKLHYMGIAFLILRESFQLKIAGSVKEYLRQRSNRYDMILIILSIALSISNVVAISKSIKIADTQIIPYLEVALILFTTISATSLLPLPYAPINMQILKKVSMTFLKIFYTFAIILIAFSLSFYIIFENNNQINNCTDANNNFMEKGIKENVEENKDQNPLDNFKYIHTSFLKIVLMLSGEYSIEPVILTSSQLCFFAIFITASFILFNLILGLSIEDVQELKNKSRHFILLTKTKKLINVGEKLNHYYKYIENYKEYRQYEKFNILKDFLINISLIIVRFALSKYIYLHGIQKVYLNIKTGEVFVNINRKYEAVLSKEKFKVETTALTEIKQIIYAKNKKMFKNLKKKYK